MPTDYTKLWEAWAGGFGEYDPLTQAESIGESRIKDFYSEIVGPAWGGEEKDFGTVFEQYIPAFDTEDFERAEREFKLAIGDPYGYEGDPFAWERLSRMTPDQAQTQLEAELFGQGKELGGEYGAEYGTSTAKALESYTTGVRGARESLTYEGLEGTQGLASGTGGSVLRSGGAQAVSEDVLIEAYKSAKDVRADYEEGKAGVEIDLEGNLNTALTAYLTSIDNEKQDWFDSIARNVTLASDLDVSYKFGVSDIGEEWGEEVYTQGLEYEEGDWFMEDAACGIGEVRNADGECVLEETLGLEKDEYGAYCEAGTVDECGVCGGDSSSCADCEGTPNGNVVDDVCGVCGGDDTSCDYGCGPNEGEKDECGVCGGWGKDLECWDGTLVCDVSECPEEPIVEEELEEGQCRSQDDCLPCYRCDAGSCLYDGISNGCGDTEDDLANTGCTDPFASNYDFNATTDDGSCEFVEEIEEEIEEEIVYGCTDPSADNYDSEATDEDGSCTYPPEGPDYEEEILSEADCVCEETWKMMQGTMGWKQYKVGTWNCPDNPNKHGTSCGGYGPQTKGGMEQIIGGTTKTGGVGQK